MSFKPKNPEQRTPASLPPPPPLPKSTLPSSEATDIRVPVERGDGASTSMSPIVAQPPPDPNPVPQPRYHRQNLYRSSQRPRTRSHNRHYQFRTPPSAADVVQLPGQSLHRRSRRARLSSFMRSAPPMDKEKSSVVEEGFVGLHTLRPGAQSPVKAMVCRKWDVTNMSGRYRSTEYILSDDQGNAIQCSARSNISHCFASKLQEGMIYCIKDFSVVPNKEKYRVRHTDACTIQLEGYTIVTKLDCPTDTFNRYPFQLTPIEDIRLNDSTFLIDVMGFAVEPGSVKTTPTGSELLDFHLINERKTRIRVNIWGTLCNDFLNRPGHQSHGYVVILTSMNIKGYMGEVYLSSTSATSLYDSPDIPQIAAYNKLMRECKTSPPQSLPPPSAAHMVSVADLIRLGREHKETRCQTMTLECKARITDIRTKDSWFYNACGMGGCKKRLARVGTGFWCETCKRNCDFPQTSFRTHVVADDETGSVVLTLFDSVAELLVKKKASVLLESAMNGNGMSVVPQELLDLVGTQHIFEVKTHTFFDNKTDVCFTVNKVVADNIHDHVTTTGKLGKRTRECSISAGNEPTKKTLRGDIGLGDNTETVDSASTHTSITAGTVEQSCQASNN